MEDMPNRRDGNHQATWEAFGGEDSEDNDEGPMKEDGKVVKLTPAQFVQIRRWILFRRDIKGVDDYYAHYCDHVLPDEMDEVERQTKFIDWLHDKVFEKHKMLLETLVDYFQVVLFSRSDRRFYVNLIYFCSFFCWLVVGRKEDRFKIVAICQRSYWSKRIFKLPCKRVCLFFFLTRE
ncbi:hypothetical protein MKW92_005669 [Papaver armeniacum]|nr:hypothetical protein MKW92_005669 [Papaver armeniacum]